MEYIKSLLVGAICLVSLVALIGGIIRVGVWCAVHLNPLISVGILSLLAFLYFSYQLGRELRRWKD